MVKFIRLTEYWYDALSGGVRDCCSPLGTPNSSCMRIDAGWNGVLKLGSSFLVTLACLTRPTAVDAAVRLASKPPVWGALLGLRQTLKRVDRTQQVLCIAGL